MHDVSKIPEPRWCNYKAACGRLAADLARLRDIFTDIAAGRHDIDSAYTEVCVAAELDSIRDELKASLDPNYRPVTADEVL